MDVEIPGGTAVLREHVSARGRGLEEAYGLPLPPVMEKLPAKARPGEPLSKYGLTAEDGLALWDFQAALVLARLESWTLDAPLPRTVEQVGEMDQEVFAVLAQKASDLFRDDQRPNFDPNPDRQSPTGLSGASKGRLRAVEGKSKSPKKSHAVTETTDIGDFSPD